MALIAVFACAFALPFMLDAVHASEGVGVVLVLGLFAAGVAAGLVIREQHL